jgi:hypothetical protein
MQSAKSIAQSGQTGSRNKVQGARLKCALQVQPWSFGLEPLSFLPSSPSASGCLSRIKTFLFKSVSKDQPVCVLRPASGRMKSVPRFQKRKAECGKQNAV